jgi:kinesin family protein 18/19
MDPNEDSDDILRANRSREKKFYFDVTFSEFSTQRQVYQATVVDRDIIGRVVSGYNCTVFAYGATGETIIPHW